MNILLNSPDLGLPGGVSKYCFVIRDYFKNNVRYFIYGRRGISDGLLNIIIKSIKNYGNYFLELNNINLVHINTSLISRAVVRDGIFLLIAKMCKKKVVVYFHGWDESCERMIHRFFLAPFRLIYFRADAIIVLATVFKKKLIDIGYRKEIYIETTSVDNGMITHGASVIASRRKESNGAGMRILYLSRIEKAKGIYEAIDAYSLAKKRMPQAVLTVVGDGPELGRAREYVATKRIPDVHFKGHLSGNAIGEVFATADVYLFPTWYGEGLPISILEAMVYGLPVLTRPVGGIPDFFENGKMGFLLESKEPELGGKARTIGKRQRTFLYQWENIIIITQHRVSDRLALLKRLELIYEKVMADAAT